MNAKSARTINLQNNLATGSTDMKAVGILEVVFNNARGYNSHCCCRE